MVANNMFIVCPKCKSVNCYTITRLEMCDKDLHATYMCDTCQTEFTDVYGLMYIGGYTSTQQYDRDNIPATGTV